MAYCIEASSVLHAHNGTIYNVRFGRQHLSKRSLSVSYLSADRVVTWKS